MSSLSLSLFLSLFLSLSLQYLLEQSDFLVVGVIGKAGSGKEYHHVSASWDKDRLWKVSTVPR